MVARAAKTTRRKRPTQARASATVDAILVASARAFRDHGFERASVNAIADLAGVSIGSLYQYFPSKEALLIALAEHHTEEALATLEATFIDVETEPLASAVRIVVGKMIEVHADPLSRVLAHGLDELGAPASMQAMVDERAGAAAARFLRARRNETRPLAIDLAALLLVRGIDLLTHAALEHQPDTIESGVLASELTTLVLGYVRRPGDK
jgi:AcrR family transcriptional regulator